MAQPRVKYLSDDERQRLHEETVWVLEHVGVGFGTPRAIDVLEAAGAPVDRQKLTARIPWALVEEALDSAPEKVLLAAREPRHDVTLGDEYLACCTDGTATYVIDDETGARHDGSAAYLRQLMRLFDALPQIDYAWPSVSARDLDPGTANLEIEVICLEECTKHLQDEVRGPQYVGPLVEILEAVAGASLKERPIFSAINCTVSPLQNDPEMTEASLLLAAAGVPIVVMPMPLMGTTAPMSTPGTVVVNMAEMLAAITLFQLAEPGCPLIAGPEPAAADMRSGLYLCGAPEAALMSLASVEMCHHYGLPTQATGAGGDGRYPDYQEGAEGMAHGVMVAMTGVASMLTFGTLDGAQSLSFAKTVLDSDAVGTIRRLTGRQRVDRAEMLHDDLAEVGIGGHFLSRKSTRRRLRDGELWQPEVFRRGAPAKGSRPDGLVAEAAAYARDLMEAHEVPPLSDDARRVIDETVRAFAATL